MNIGRNTYSDMLKASKLREVCRGDPSSYIEMDDYYLWYYLVSPVFNEEGKKVGWELSHDEHGLAGEYQTKKEAMDRLPGRREEPWYAGLPGYDTPQGVYLSDGMYGHADGRVTGGR